LSWFAAIFGPASGFLQEAKKALLMLQREIRAIQIVQ
jgi:hypothetical protein